MNYLPVFKALSSEAMLVVTALVVLTVDLVRGRQLEAATRRQLAGALALLGLAASAMPLVWQMSDVPVTLWGGTLVVTPLTLIFKFLLIVLTAFAVLISADHELGEHVGEYFALMLFAAIGMLLLVSTEELLTLFVALELTSLSLYVLTAFHKHLLRSQEAALKYFLFGAISTAFLLFGLSYLYGVTGSTSFRSFAGQGTSPLLAVGLLCMLVGLGFKVAVVPFHLWAPDAYEGAPTPVAAFIATGAKVASFFVLLKLLLVGMPAAMGAALWGHWQPGWAALLAVVATASMLLGNLAAIVQKNVKRLLAYSSIAHAGYILIGVVAATNLPKDMGKAAVLFYVIVYALTNLGAFGVIAALASRAGGEDLAHFNGMARRAPLLSLVMLIFVLSLAGVPPLGGFFGKFYLFAAAVQRDSTNFGLLWLVVVGILMSAVSLYYYLIVMKHFYVLPVTAGAGRVRTPVQINVALAILAILVVLMGAMPQPILTLLNNLVSPL